MRWKICCLAALLALCGPVLAVDLARVPLADGFDIPVGANGKSYYKARGVRPNGHLGEDWNGVGGGDTDLGDPIYATADGIVVFAEDYRLGWGNVVIIRHAYLEDGDTKYVDSLYGHLLDFTVRVDQLVKRGQQIARMGNNRGQYDAHLHFEMRKNITVGMYRSSFPRDWSVYWSPTEFVAAHRELRGDSRIVSVPINTFPNSPPPVIAVRKVETPIQTISQARARGQIAGSTSSGTSRKVVPKKTSPITSTSGPSKSRLFTPATPEKKKGPVRHPLFKVNRFEDMKVLGYE
jgi:hypothetical protein